MAAVVWFLSVVLVGLVAGIFLATQLGQVRVQDSLGARDFTLVKHRFEVALGRVMPALVILAGVSMLPVIVLAYPDGLVRFTLVVLALLLWVAVIVVTVTYNVPVNRLAAQWDPSAPPADWEALRDRWRRGQTLRTPLAIAAFASLTVATVLPPPPS